MKDHKISLTILYDCYIAQARLLRHLIDELEGNYENHFADTEGVSDDELVDTLEYNDEMRDMYYDEEGAIAELYLLHDNMLDNAEEISCHLKSGRIDTKKIYDRKERKYKRLTEKEAK
tara:strand:+ start:177 stop:530 length:354 start_codon:yes stop_codon:yes gene_type:complete